MDDAQISSCWTDKVQPHLGISMRVAIEQGIPPGKAVYLGLGYFAGAAVTVCETEAEASHIREIRDALYAALSLVADTVSVISASKTKKDANP